MRWLYKLEYKYGRYCIRNLMTILVAGMALVYLLNQMLTINLLELLSFSRPLIARGQAWRIITFIFIPPGGNTLLLLINLYCYYLLGNLLEQVWGSFKLNVYYLVGIIGAIIAGLISPLGYTSNVALNSSLFLAVAASMPDTQFRLFFLMPIKAKWLGIAYFVFMLPDVFNAFRTSAVFGISYLIILAFSLLNFFIFFGPTLVKTVRNQIRIWKNRRNWNNRNR